MGSQHAKDRESGEALTQQGLSVQTNLLEQSDRDKVIVKIEDGIELASHANMQHNKNYHDLANISKKLAEQVELKLKEVATHKPSENEANDTTDVTVSG